MDGLDDLGWPHLADRGVDQQRQHIQRDHHQYERQCGSEDGIERGIDGSQGDQGVEGNGHEGSEVDLVQPAAQELVKDLGRSGSRRTVAGPAGAART